MAQIILVTNDDGIDSHFLRVLVEALLTVGFDVRVAAPLGEQSWISRAVSRRRDVHLAEFHGFKCPAWSLDGTPTDCVNIALGHLLREKPAAVVSGINLGVNTSLPYILSSGTVGGALEGAFWGLPSFAFSMELPDDRMEDIRHQHGRVDGTLGESLRCAAGHGAKFVQERLAQNRSDRSPTVHNVNFPALTTPVTPVVHTRPGRLKLGTLFHQESPGCFNFRYMDEADSDPDHAADHTAVMRGCISYTVLDYGVLGVGIKEKSIPPFRA